MTRGQIGFGIVMVLTFTVLTRWTLAEAGARDARIRSERLDRVNLVLVASLDSAAQANAPLAAENERLALLVADSAAHRIVRDSLQRAARRHEAIANDLAGRVREEIPPGLMARFDSTIAEKDAAIGAHRTRADSAEAQLTVVLPAYSLAQELIADMRGELDISRMVIDSMTVNDRLKDAIIARLRHPPLLTRIKDAIPAVGTGVLLTVAGVVVVTR